MIQVKKTLAAVCVLVLMVMLAAPLVLAADQVTMTGQVVLEDEAYVLVTADGKYLLDGIDESLVDKKVTVTGTVEDGEGGEKWLVVETAEEMK